MDDKDKDDDEKEDGDKVVLIQSKGDVQRIKSKSFDPSLLWPTCHVWATLPIIHIFSHSWPPPSFLMIDTMEYLYLFPPFDESTFFPRFRDDGYQLPNSPLTTMLYLIIIDFPQKRLDLKLATGSGKPQA